MSRLRAGQIGIVLLVIAQGLAACGKGRIPEPPTTPTGGTIDNSPPTTGAAQTSFLRGFVADTAGRPLVGASVEVLDGAQAGAVAATDSSGWFRLTGTFDDAIRLRVAKEGHISRTATVAFWRGDGPPGYVSMALAVLDPPVSLTGDYSLTFIADETCTEVPPELRTRTYHATIEDSGDPKAPAGTFLWANVTGISYLANQRRIPILIAGDVISFWLGEHGYGAALVEQVAPNTYLQFDGGATVAVGQSPVSTISTTFEGAVDYCVMQSPMTGSHYDCSVARSITNVHCVSKNHQLSLTRR